MEKEIKKDTKKDKPQSPKPIDKPVKANKRHRTRIILAGILFLIILALGAYFFIGKSKTLTPRETVDAMFEAWENKDLDAFLSYWGWIDDSPIREALYETGEFSYAKFYIC